MWRLTPGLALRYRTWDNSAYVLYNNLSGDTHLLDASAIEILDTLQRGVAPLLQLALALQLDSDPDSLAQLAEMLDELQHLSLIDPVAC